MQGVLYGVTPAGGALPVAAQCEMLPTHYATHFRQRQHLAQLVKDAGPQNARNQAAILTCEAVCARDADLHQ